MLKVTRFSILAIALLSFPVSAARQEIPLIVNFVDDLSEIPQNRNMGFFGFVGYSDTDQDGNCIVSLQKPINWNDDRQMMILGHEVMHCIDGAHNGTIYFNEPRPR